MWYWINTWYQNINLLSERVKLKSYLRDFTYDPGKDFKKNNTIIH